MTARTPQKRTTSWRALFGVVPDRGLRRRPSEVGRIAFGAVVVLVGAIGARNLSNAEVLFKQLVDDLPSVVLSALQLLYDAGAAIAVAVLLLAAVLARRPRFVIGILASAALAGAVGLGLQHWIDAPAALSDAPPGYPQYPRCAWRCSPRCSSRLRPSSPARLAVCSGSCSWACRSAPWPSPTATRPASSARQSWR